MISLSPVGADAAGPSLTATPSPQTIYGGENALTCEWPTAVEIGGCTGTLVHPEVVIYAGHCGSNVSQAYFGESIYGGGGRTVATQFCRTMPGWQPGAGTDFAVCKLSQPVTDVQITPILMGCETEVLTPGREVVLVGFGQTETGGSGVKKEVVTTVDHLANEEVFVGGGGLAPCYGDSGGPAFVKLAAADGYDDTWRVFGVTSHGDQVCGGGGYYGMMHNAIDWFESETGVDITPCHDADGTWNPTADCTNFPKDPGGSTGAWSNGCAPVPEGGPSATCGAPNADLDLDDTPPVVKIEAPVDGDSFDGPSVALEVLVDAVDTGQGVAQVVVAVDGNPLVPDPQSPYVFSVSLGDGSHTLSATADDLAGNVSESQTVTVHIGEQPGGGNGDGAGPPDNDGQADGGGDPDDDGPAGDAGDGSEGEDGGYLPPGFGLDDDAAGCTCRATSATTPPRWLAFVVLALGATGRTRRRGSGRARLRGRRS